MRVKNFRKNYIICPRCGLKSLSVAESCPDCGLVFSRLEIATNKDAKRKIRRRDKDYIIMTSKLPKDVNWYMLIALVIFTGLFGGHCFYVGRYWRGTLLLVNTLTLFMYVIFNAQLVAIDGGKLIAALSTIGGLIMLVWAVDVVWIFIKKFKVPIAIDLESESAEIVSQDEEKVQQEQESILSAENQNAEVVDSAEENTVEKLGKKEKDSDEDSSGD